MPEQHQDEESAVFPPQSEEPGEESHAISVYPQEGEILPGKEQTMTLKFSPLDVGEFSRILRIKWVKRRTLARVVV